MIAKLHLAAMRSRDVARDAQAQPGATGFPAARAFEPIERFEHRFQFALRYSGAVIADSKREFGGAFLDTNLRPLAIRGCVVDQIGDGAPEELRCAEVGL